MDIGEPVRPPVGTRPSIEERVRRIEESRRRFEATLGQLRREARHRLAWRSQVRRHPLAALGSAAVAGFLLALAVGRRRPRRDHGSHTEPESAPAPRATAGLGRTVAGAFARTVLPLLIQRGAEHLSRGLWHPDGAADEPPEV